MVTRGKIKDDTIMFTLKSGQIEMIHDRTRNKCQSMREKIFDQYPIPVENIEEKLKKLKSQETKLNQDINSVKQISNVMKKLSKNHKELSNSYRRIRYGIGKPSSLILDDKRPVLSTLRKISNGYYNEVNNNINNNNNI
ncbi:hypothetical protein PIROE2DRAFT_63548 [Piromyces sp. E2]|nr:hypothetical protein PIROE2DRAFT_63548 [Piromyces sp. E2]|eukprot:OUM59793.1 hypothetical protein PIROE2DRAFT_63548 [Piromyces sp. E2]